MQMHCWMFIVSISSWRFILHKFCFVQKGPRPAAMTGSPKVCASKTGESDTSAYCPFLIDFKLNFGRVGRGNPVAAKVAFERKRDGSHKVIEGSDKLLVGAICSSFQHSGQILSKTTETI